MGDFHLSVESKITILILSFNHRKIKSNRHPREDVFSRFALAIFIFYEF